MVRFLAIRAVRRQGNSTGNSMKAAKTVAALATILFALRAGAGVADELVGKIVKIKDGDTVVLLDSDNRTHSIRLSGIDAPEIGQDFGQKAKKELSQLVALRPCVVEWHKKDRYNRPVGKLLVDGQDINLLMLRRGLAWWYRKYANEQLPEDRSAYAMEERVAQNVKLGLWEQVEPVPPWDWRKTKFSTGDYLTACPCDSEHLCTGKRGGQFCVRPGGSKRYYVNQG